MVRGRILCAFVGEPAMLTPAQSPRTNVKSSGAAAEDRNCVRNVCTSRACATITPLAVGAPTIVMTATNESPAIVPLPSHATPENVRRTPRPPVDRDGDSAAGVRTGLPRVRAPGRNPHGQRRTLRDASRPRTVLPQRVVDAAGDRAPAHPPGRTAGERGARADAPDAQAPGGQAGAADVCGAAEAVRRLPGRVQHGAAPRRVRRRHAGVALCGVTTAARSGSRRRNTRDISW
jgi:hypothetical protein